MGSRLNYAKQKRLAKARRHGDPGTDMHLPRTRDTGGWRTEYPEEFPVTVTRVTTPRQTKGLAA